MRTYLSPGTVIPVTGEGATRQVYIEQVIGEGASCIVYDGFFVDVPGVKERCRLKECYPLDAKIVRQGDQLVWSDPAERLSAQKRFQSIRQISYDMRYNPEVGNQITKSGYYENGDNFYLIMDINHGQTLDKENTKDINRILKITLKLTQLVGKLHNLGCRYLDLKPDNILVSNDPDPDIWLFDFDSLVPMDNSNTISYSKGWAAPELIQGKFSSLCNATDLYSIGAILFRKIMGRSVSNDDIGLFADWDFAGELFDDVNPKVQRYLREIFKKTLSASVKRRYQSAAELELALEQTLGEVGKPYVISNIPDNSSNFVGRDQELLDIRDVFTSENHIVFLTGIGGIGKSELAKHYGNMQQSNYDAVIFASFEDSINSLLLDIEIQNFDGDDKQKIKQLNRLLDHRVLLVIDNMDAEEIPDFNVLAKLKCDILITSRLDWKEYSFPTIEVGSLSEVDQFGLFLKEYGGALDIPQQQAVLRILSSIQGYTLLIPLLAKQMRKGHYDFDEVEHRINIAGIKSTSNGKVRHLKDDIALSGSVYSIVAEVLSMANFCDEEKYVMRSLALLGKYKIDQGEFLQWIDQEYIDQLDDLIFSSWVDRSQCGEKTYLCLHSVISEVCFEELSPCVENCWGIAEHFRNLVLDLIQWDFEDDAEYVAVEPTCRMIFSFLRSLKIDNAENLKYCIDVLHRLIENNSNIIDLHGTEDLSLVVRRIDECIDNVQLDDQYYFMARAVIEAVWFSANPPIFESELPWNNPDNHLILTGLFRPLFTIDYFIKDIRVQALNEAIVACGGLCASEVAHALYQTISIAIKGMYRTNATLSVVEGELVEIPNEGIEHEWVEIAEVIDAQIMSFLEKYASDCDFEEIEWLSECHEVITNWLESWNSVDIEDDEEEDLTPEQREIVNRDFAETIVANITGPAPEKIESILNNPCLTNIEKAERLVIQEPFNTWTRHTSDYNANRWLDYHNWEYVLALLDAQIELLYAEADSWTESEARFFGDATVNRTITWAILEAYEPFFEQMHRLLSLHIQELHMQLVEEKPILLSLSFDNSHFGHVINALRCIYKSHLAFSYVMDFIGFLEDCSEVFGDFTKYDLLHFYQMAHDIANEAIQEGLDDDGTLAKEKANLSKIISGITGVDITALTPKDE